MRRLTPVGCVGSAPAMGAYSGRKPSLTGKEDASSTRLPRLIVERHNLTPMFVPYPFTSSASAVIVIMLAALFLLAWRFFDRLLLAWIRRRFPDPPPFVDYPSVRSPWSHTEFSGGTASYQGWLLTLRTAAIDLATHSSSSRARMREFKRIIGELQRFEEAHHIPVAALKASTPTTRAE